MPDPGSSPGNETTRDAEPRALTLGSRSLTVIFTVAW